MYNIGKLRQDLEDTFGKDSEQVHTLEQISQRILDCERAGIELLPMLTRAGIPPPVSFIALDSPKSWFDSHYKDRD